MVGHSTIYPRLVRLRLHGAFRSGTNYMKALLEINGDVELSGDWGGWKHAPIPAPYEGPPVLGVVRDPFVWVVSLWRFVESGGRKHITCGPSWRSFVSDPITVTHGERNWPVFRFASPADYWNAMTASLMSSATIVRYEDARDQPAETCEKLAAQFGIALKPVFTPVVMRTRNMVDRRRTVLEDYVTDERYVPSELRTTAGGGFDVDSTTTLSPSSTSGQVFS